MVARLVSAAVALFGVASALTSPEGLEFLKANAERSEVIVLPSGLQYEYLERGTGAHHPTPDSPCDCHYEGTLINGDVFDSSYARGPPTTFAPNQVIPGWTEAMQLMVEGDKLKLYIPSEMAYGERGSPPKIGPNAALVFVIEIVKIKGDVVLALKCDAATKENCSQREIDYVAKIVESGQSEIKKQLARLEKMLAGGVSGQKNKAWVENRVFLLNQLDEETQHDKEDL